MGKSGIELKIDMGLENQPKVYISYVYKSSPDVYIVWYNSIRPMFPINKSQLKTFSNLNIFHGRDNKYTSFSPPFPIEKYNGLGKGIFLVYDLAYAERTKNKHFAENVNAFYKGKLEEITLVDLKNKDAIAPSTMKYRKERNKVMGLEKSTAKIIDVFLNEAEDSITFAFITGATNKYPKGYDYQRVSPLNLNLISNKTKKYEIQIKFLGIQEWLEAFKGSELTIQDIQEIIKTLDVKVFSTSPSFQFQSYNNSNTKLGTSIYPNTKPDKGEWEKKLGGEYFLDKHLYGIVANMGTFLPKMAKMLNKKLKDRGLL